MDDNPYESPLSSSPPNEPKPFDITAIIWYRRITVVCLALLVPYLVLCLFLLDPPIFQADLRETSNPRFGNLIHSVALVALLVASILTGLLASKLYGPHCGCYSRPRRLLPLHRLSVGGLGVVAVAPLARERRASAEVRWKLTLLRSTKAGDA